MCGELADSKAAVATADAGLQGAGSSSSAYPVAKGTPSTASSGVGFSAVELDLDSNGGSGSTHKEITVARPSKQRPPHLPAIETAYPLLRSQTWPQFDPDPFTPKFYVADPSRRCIQIQTLVDSVQIGDLYDLGAVIGSGGFGKVKDSLNSYTFEPYAVKVMPKARIAAQTKSSHDLTEANFRETVEFLMNQRQRYVVTVARTFEDAKFYYVVMEKCTGGDLGAHVSLLRDEQRQLEESKLQEIVCMVGEALGYLHSNFRLHRDVKPENILFETEERNVIKLADFDMCCSYPGGEESVTSSSVVGTPGYLAPEVLELKSYSRRSDLFSLGVLMHFCATGEAPKATTCAQDVTDWCEMTALKLTEGSGVRLGMSCVRYGASPEFLRAMGSLLKADPLARPDRLETFMDCAWLEALVGTPKKKKNSPKKSSLKKQASLDESTIQRLLTMKVDIESPIGEAVAVAA
jgi:serine/threonine protein kinase